MTTEPTDEQITAVVKEFFGPIGLIRLSGHVSADDALRAAEEIVTLRAAIAKHREAARHYAAAGIEPFFFDYDLWEHLEEAE